MRLMRPGVCVVCGRELAQGEPRRQRSGAIGMLACIVQGEVCEPCSEPPASSERAFQAAALELFVQAIREERRN